MFNHGLIPADANPAFECGRCGWRGNWPKRISYQDVRCCPDCGDQVAQVGS